MNSHVYFSQLLNLSLLTVLCLDKDHSDIFNDMPKHIIVALPFTLLLPLTRSVMLSLFPVVTN